MGDCPMRGDMCLKLVARTGMWGFIVLSRIYNNLFPEIAFREVRNSKLIMKLQVLHKLLSAK